MNNNISRSRIFREFMKKKAEEKNSTTKQKQMAREKETFSKATENSKNSGR